MDTRGENMWNQSCPRKCRMCGLHSDILSLSEGPYIRGSYWKLYHVVWSLGTFPVGLWKGRVTISPEKKLKSLPCRLEKKVSYVRSIVAHILLPLSNVAGAKGLIYSLWAASNAIGYREGNIWSGTRGPTQWQTHTFLKAFSRSFLQM